MYGKRLRQEIDPDANIIYGHTIDEKLAIQSVYYRATGIDASYQVEPYRI